MKNKIDFQKFLATWKAKWKKCKAAVLFGLQNIAPSLGQKKLENQII